MYDRTHRNYEPFDYQHSWTDIRRKEIKDVLASAPYTVRKVTFHKKGKQAGSVSIICGDIRQVKLSNEDGMLDYLRVAFGSDFILADTTQRWESGRINTTIRFYPDGLPRIMISGDGSYNDFRMDDYLKPHRVPASLIAAHKEGKLLSREVTRWFFNRIRRARKQYETVITFDRAEAWKRIDEMTAHSLSYITKLNRENTAREIFVTRHEVDGKRRYDVRVAWARSYAVPRALRNETLPYFKGLSAMAAYKAIHNIKADRQYDCSMYGGTKKAYISLLEDIAEAAMVL